MQNNYSKQEMEYAGFWVRLAAWMVDNAVLFAGLLVVRGILAIISALSQGSLLSTDILFHYTLKDIILYLCKAMYFVLLTYCTGTTLGKRLFNLRVVSVEYSCNQEETKLNFWNVVYRETIGRFLSGILLGIGYLMIVPDREKRGLHDRLADTKVVYAKKVMVYEIPVQALPPIKPGKPQSEESQPGESQPEKPQPEEPKSGELQSGKPQSGALQPEEPQPKEVQPGEVQPEGHTEGQLQ